MQSAGILLHRFEVKREYDPQEVYDKFLQRSGVMNVMKAITLYVSDKLTGVLSVRSCQEAPSLKSLSRKS